MSRLIFKSNPLLIIAIFAITVLAFLITNSVEVYAQTESTESTKSKEFKGSANRNTYAAKCRELQNQCRTSAPPEVSPPEGVAFCRSQCDAYCATKVASGNRRKVCNVPGGYRGIGDGQPSECTPSRNNVPLPPGAGEITVVCTYQMSCGRHTCKAPEQQSQVSEQPVSPSLFQRIGNFLGIGERNGDQNVLVEVEVPLPQQTSSTYTHSDNQPSPRVSNPTNRPQAFEVNVYENGTLTQTGQGVIPANTKNAQVKLVNGELSSNATVIYQMSDAANGAGFINNRDITEKFNSAKDAFSSVMGLNSNQTIRLKIPKNGATVQLTMTPNNAEESFSLITEDGKTREVKKLEETVNRGGTGNLTYSLGGIDVNNIPFTLLENGGDRNDAKVVLALFGFPIFLFTNPFSEPGSSQAPEGGGTIGGAGWPEGHRDFDSRDWDRDEHNYTVSQQWRNDKHGYLTSKGWLENDHEYNASRRWDANRHSYRTTKQSIEGGRHSTAFSRTLGVPGY